MRPSTMHRIGSTALIFPSEPTVLQPAQQIKIDLRFPAGPTG
jgi:hypothetical protein